MGNRPVVPNIRDFVLRSLMLTVLEANWVKKKKERKGPVEKSLIWRNILELDLEISGAF